LCVHDSIGPVGARVRTPYRAFRVAITKQGAPRVREPDEVSAPLRACQGAVRRDRNVCGVPRLRVRPHVPRRLDNACPFTPAKCTQKAPSVPRCRRI
ncbi:uncharacterized protein TRAVEDRAFT_32517, partial [Trametes versicolor FP-101664 SS1]